MNKLFNTLTIRSLLVMIATVSLLLACENANIGGKSSDAADISFKDQRRDTLSLTSLEGKVVFINFWATWCPPCIHEMPSIDALKKSFDGNDNIIFLMVDVDNNIKQSTAFMEENNYDLPVYTPASIIPSSFLDGAIPTTVILDKRGNIAEHLEGGRDYGDPEIAQTLNELIEAK